MTSVDDVVREVSKSFISKGFQSDLEKSSKSLGLVGEVEGTFCLAAGSHPDLPDMFIKVVRGSDPYYRLVRDIFEGHLRNDHLPRVFSVSEIGDTDTYVVVVEKLVPLDKVLDQKLSSEGHYLMELLDATSCYMRGDDMDLVYKDLAERLGAGLWECVNIIRDYIERFDYLPDIHAANVGFRGNTFVLLDPMWTPEIPRREEINYEETNVVPF